MGTITVANRISTLCLTAALSLGALTGCKRGGEATADKSGSEQGAGEGREPSADKVEGAKLSAAIECLNRHSGRAFEARREYLEAVDPATGSSRGKNLHLGALYGIDACQRDLKEAGGLAPAIPDLDKASAAYSTALGNLSLAYGDVLGYYQKGDYLEDQGKKALELHPKLMAAFKAFGEANRDLSTIVKTRNRQRRMTKLAAREKAEGRNLEVIIDTMMLEAETLVSMASSPEGDSAALDAQTALYGKLVDELDAYANTHPDEAKKRGSIANLRNYAKTFLAASRAVARKVRTKAEPTPNEMNDVDRQYNYLVDNYNHH